MKKFLTKLILSVACVTALATCLVGCGENNGGTAGDTPSLRYNSKYYTETSGPEEERGYYTFSANGTGKYYNYYHYESSYSGDITENYTVSFKYTYTNADKTRIACFYDGVTYTDKDNQKDVSSSWTHVLEVSENVLLSQGQYGYYIAAINEEYLKQLPNFGKETD